MISQRFPGLSALFLVLILVAGCASEKVVSSASAPLVPVKNPDGSLTVIVSPQTTWSDTGIFLRPGDKVVATAQGTWGEAPGVDRGPDGGKARMFGYWGQQRPAPTAPWGALIARVGGSPAFVVGAQNTFIPPQEGELFLGCNAGAGQQAQAHGSLSVHLAIVPQ